jgi:hypothetical protein
MIGFLLFILSKFKNMNAFGLCKKNGLGYALVFIN